MGTIALLLLILSPLGDINAASEKCDYGLSPCEAYATADSVFIGKVVRIIPESFTLRQFEQGYDQTVYVEIEKVYKGYKGRKIVLKQLARKQAETFINGSSYLFYANFDRTAKHWEVRPCGRTRMANYVQDDLRYLDKLPTHPRRTRVAGEVVRFYTAPDIGRTTERVAGIRIKIVGDGKEYEVTTDEKGVYELYDIPPGQYRLQPLLPKELEFLMALHYGADVRSRVKSLEIDLAEQGCSGATIILETVKEQIGAEIVRPEPPNKASHRSAGSTVLMLRALPFARPPELRRWATTRQREDVMESIKDASHHYEVERRALHAERPGFRISELQIGPTQSVPWHFHSAIHDTFYVIEGTIRLSLRDPEQEVRLGPGETYTVRVRRPHLVTNGGEVSATFLVLQGIGEYDYVPLV